jgi:hypothetical protein
MLTIRAADRKREKEKEQRQEAPAHTEQEQGDSTGAFTITAHTTDAPGNTTVKEFALTDEEQVQLGAALSPFANAL